MIKLSPLLCIVMLFQGCAEIEKVRGRIRKLRMSSQL